MEVKTATCSREALGRFLKEEEEEEEEEDGEFHRFSDWTLRYIYSTLSIYLARVELVKLSAML